MDKNVVLGSPESNGEFSCKTKWQTYHVIRFICILNTSAWTYARHAITYLSNNNIFLMTDQNITHEWGKMKENDDYKKFVNISLLCWNFIMICVKYILYVTWYYYIINILNIWLKKNIGTVSFHNFVCLFWDLNHGPLDAQLIPASGSNGPWFKSQNKSQNHA